MVSRRHILLTILLALALVVTASVIIEAYGEATSRGGPEVQSPTLPGTPLPDDGVWPTAPGGVPTPAEARTAVLGAMVAAHRLRGVASWYATPGLTGAAGPALRDALGGDPAFRGERVTVCSEACVTLTLTDWCLCPERGGQPTLIDLSTAAFRRLAPLSAGVIAVTVTHGLAVAARPTPPATDR